MTQDRQSVHERAARTAKLLAALANPHRLLILCHLLQHGETGAGVLAERFGFGHSALSQHLARMRAQSLITQRREGRALFYRLNDALSPQLPPLLTSVCETVSPSPRAKLAAPPTAAVGLAIASVLGAPDDGLWRTPAIRGAGRVRAMAGAAYQPDRRAIHKVTLALSHASDDAARVNPGLARVARLVNLYADAGVPQHHRRLVAAVSGPAVALALDDAHYRAAFGIANPNLPVLHELRRAAVEVAVCGQALAERHYAREWLCSDVTLALSALTTLAELERKGYALLPL